MITDKEYNYKPLRQKVVEELQEVLKAKGIDSYYNKEKVIAYGRFMDIRDLIFQRIYVEGATKDNIDNLDIIITNMDDIINNLGLTPDDIVFECREI